MKRKIIEIDERKCNGCGACLPNCPEGAIQLIDGKARLVSDLFCDGLGACLGTCPRGAIDVVEREAEAYDECKVMENIVRQGSNTVKAHLEHLKSHGENDFYSQGIAFLNERGIAVPQLDRGGSPCHCPGVAAKLLSPAQSEEVTRQEIPSALRQWPIQLHLLNPDAGYFDNADLLISADCVAHAFGDFHRKMLNGKILIVFCPKLDGSTEEYIQKLSEIFRRHPIRSITVARMEVPCCGGTVAIVEKALKEAGKQQNINIHVVGINGNIER